MGYVPANFIKERVMRKQGELLSVTERKEKSIQILTEELGEVVKKVNYHFHSGYVQNDLRKPESIFINFFKKQPSIIHSSYLMRIKNRDFKIEFDENKIVKHIHFTDLSYESYHGMVDTIETLNKACEALDYEALRKASNTMDKFFQTTRNIIQKINDFKFG